MLKFEAFVGVGAIGDLLSEFEFELFEFEVLSEFSFIGDSGVHGLLGDWGSLGSTKSGLEVSGRMLSILPRRPVKFSGLVCSAFIVKSTNTVQIVSNQSNKLESTLFKSCIQFNINVAVYSL